MFSPRTKGMGILYLALGIAGFLLGMVKALPAFITVLQGGEITLNILLPWLILSWVMLVISGTCLWKFAPSKRR